MIISQHLDIHSYEVGTLASVVCVGNSAKPVLLSSLLGNELLLSGKLSIGELLFVCYIDLLLVHLFVVKLLLFITY